MKECAFGRVLETKVINLNECIHRIEKRFDIFQERLETKMTDLFNHQSSRLPMWATTVIALLSSLCVGLVVAILK